ncbi:MAG: adenylate/guanylate cyclase domain-containing protein [Actinomycetota bacterium]
MPVCANCNEDNPERAKFCLACGSPLAATAPAREVRKTVTVLFSDVTGSTALGEANDPEAMRSVMERYFDRMKLVIESHGGTVEKFIGDAIMAVFGVPEVHEDDALRAVRAAGEMREALAALNSSLEGEFGARIRARIGVNTGPVVAGDPTAGQRLVTGDAVNVAARLEQAAQPDEILIGAETYGLVRGAVTVEPVEPVAAKGKADPVPALRLTGVTPGAAGVTRRLDAPIVGREHELSLLMQAFERAVRERSCHLFTILGAAGVGKSRLVHEVMTGLEDQATVLRGRCLPYGDGITFFPLLEAIPEAAGIRDDDSHAGARSKIEALCRGEEHADRIANAICELLDFAEGSTSLEDQFWAVRRLFEHLARQRPLVVEFDDIHWAEPKFLDLIEHIADWARDAPILLLCVARHELLDRRQGWGGGKMNATSLNLEPLTEKECDRLVEYLLGRAEIAEEARKRITEAAEGNPLFVEEMLSMLIEDGSLVRRDGRWVPAGDLGTVAVPPTIQALVAARIDRLGPGERAALERAAVAGKVFWRGAVLALSPTEQRGAVDTNLLALVRKDLVRHDRSTFAGEDAFRFRHLVIRDAAYNGIAKRVRADLHERFANWLIGSTGERAAEYEEIIAYHYEQAFRNLDELGIKDEHTTALGIEAGTRLADAGRRGQARGDSPASVNLIRRAMAALPRSHPARTGALPDLILAYLNVGGLDEADAVAAELRAIADETRDESASRQAEIGTAAVGIWRATPGSAARARTVATEAIAAFERIGDDRGLASAWDLLSQAEWFRLRAGDTAAAAERALAYARRSGERGREDSLISTLWLTLIFGPTPWREAVQRSEQLFREHETQSMEASHRSTLANALMAEGRFDEGRREKATARSIAEDLGLDLWAAGFTQGEAHLERYAGEHEAAARILRDGADTLGRLGEGAMRSTNLSHLARVLAYLGRYDEAERAAVEARETGDELDNATQVGWRTAMAIVTAQGDDAAEAERLIREALGMLEDSDFIEYRAEVLIDGASVLRAIGRHDEAEAWLAEAEELYAAKGTPVMVDRVRALRAAR